MLVRQRLRVTRVLRSATSSRHPVVSSQGVSPATTATSAAPALFCGLPTPPGGSGELILWRSFRNMRHLTRVGPIAAVALIFASLAVHCLFMTEWSPETSFFDLITGSVLRRDATNNRVHGLDDDDDVPRKQTGKNVIGVGAAALDLDAPDTWLDRRVHARRQRYFGRFTGLQMSLAAVYSAISAFAFFAYWRASTTLLQEVTAVYLEHRVVSFRVVLFGPFLTPLTKDVPFRDFVGKSVGFTAPYEANMKARAFSGKPVLVAIKGVKNPLVIFTPDRHQQPLPGEVWQPRKLHALLTGRTAGGPSTGSNFFSHSAE